MLPSRLSMEERTTMDEDRTSYPYGRFTITTLRDEGVWWARARITAKEAGGDRPVVGGPWKSRPGAQTAAELFCTSGKAG